MPKGAYYNEIDKKAAEWIRQLIKANLIAPGDVDTRSIEDVTPNDLNGYTQCHFFAGIGIWSGALRAAGWPDNEPVWTGSCPCQPFSAAGKRAGVADERHLWPSWLHLIRVSKPRIILGEQVAGKNGLAWLDIVQTDLEAMEYTSGAVPMAAAGFGAPHIRERTYWVAHSPEQGRLSWWRSSEEGNGRGQARLEPGRLCAADGVAHDSSSRLDTEGQGAEGEARNKAWLWGPERGCPAGGMGNIESVGRIGWQDDRDGGWGQCPSGQAGEDGGMGKSGRERCDGEQVCLQSGQSRQNSSEASRSSGDLRPSPTNGFWRDVDWLSCRDGKWRPVEPSTFPLVNGSSGRVGRLRGYGNGIVLPQAQAFIEVVMEYLSED